MDDDCTTAPEVGDRHVQVIASGAALAPIRAVAADLLICADGGLAAARAAGRTVDLVVGDLDSASSDDITAAVAEGARVERHLATKDESDLELALLAAVDAGATSLTVHLGAGGRLDHQLANLAVLTSPRWQTASLTGWVGDDRVWVVRDDRRLPLEPGSRLAIQAMGGPARVRTEGLEFPLTDEVLDPAEARGIANMVVATPVRVQVDDGVVIVMSPQAESAHAV